MWAGIGVALGLVIVQIITVVLRRKRHARAPPVPAQGQATMADVERLARAGAVIAAIRCYRQIHGCGLAEAKTAVDQIRSSPGTWPSAA